LDLILINGFVYNNKIINVILGCIVCDVPAKALIKSMRKSLKVPNQNPYIEEQTTQWSKEKGQTMIYKTFI
jgi:hypothetical protein